MDSFTKKMMQDTMDLVFNTPKQLKISNNVFNSLKEGNLKEKRALATDILNSLFNDPSRKYIGVLEKYRKGIDHGTPEKDLDFIIDEGINLVRKGMLVTTNGNLLSKDEEKNIEKSLINSDPSDFIEINRTGFSEFAKLWQHNKSWERYKIVSEEGEIYYSIPSDIIVSGTVPIEDLAYSVIDENGEIFVKSRIQIYPNYQDLVETAANIGIENVIVGILAFEMPTLTKVPDATIYHYLLAYPDEIRLNISTMGLKSTLGKKDRDYLISNEDNLFRLAGKLVGVWYGMQVALLHPVVKNVFTKSEERRKRRQFGGLVNAKTSKVKYIKYHHINESIDTSYEEPYINQEGRTFTRKKMAWYVIGHKRKRNGKIGFVRPYWKGPMRELKKGEYREREIIVPESIKEDE